MNDLDEDVTEEMARDAARLWKSCTSGDAIGEGEFTELECLTDECSSTGSKWQGLSSPPAPPQGAPGALGSAYPPRGRASPLDCLGCLS